MGKKRNSLFQNAQLEIGHFSKHMIPAFVVELWCIGRRDQPTPTGHQSGGLLEISQRARRHRGNNRRAQNDALLDIRQQHRHPHHIRQRFDEERIIGQATAQGQIVDTNPAGQQAFNDPTRLVRESLHGGQVEFYQRKLRFPVEREAHNHAGDIGIGQRRSISVVVGKNVEFVGEERDVVQTVLSLEFDGTLIQVFVAGGKAAK